MNSWTLLKSEVTAKAGKYQTIVYLLSIDLFTAVNYIGCKMYLKSLESGWKMSYAPARYLLTQMFRCRW